MIATQPTFIIAGAEKSGTSTLYSLLNAHPEVGTALGLKETNYFIKEGESARYYKGSRWYNHLFESKQGAKAIGEASPAYMTDLDAPKLIYNSIPRVQLLFILRDPADRLYSHYWFMTQKGVKLPSFESVFAERPPEFMNWLNISQYHLHLRRYLKIFPTQQVKVLILDDLKNNALKFIQGVYQYVGVDPSFIPSNLNERRNQARKTRSTLINHWMRVIGFRLMKLDLPAPTLEQLQKIRRKLWLLNNRPRQYPPLRPEMRQNLINEFTPTIDFVETFLDRLLPSWHDVEDQ